VTSACCSSVCRTCRPLSGHSPNVASDQFSTSYGAETLVFWHYTAGCVCREIALSDQCLSRSCCVAAFGYNTCFCLFSTAVDLVCWYFTKCRVNLGGTSGSVMSRRMPYNKHFTALHRLHCMLHVNYYC
jgi:hypothetical protein